MVCRGRSRDDDGGPLMVGFVCVNGSKFKRQKGTPSLPHLTGEILEKLTGTEIKKGLKLTLVRMTPYNLSSMRCTDNNRHRSVIDDRLPPTLSTTTNPSSN